MEPWMILGVLQNTLKFIS
uniref:Uncharacterized protein n=1 Tax=Anguilla anguilla TaxID=7936 RepID=A0A0E9TRP5_ANGAN